LGFTVLSLAWLASSTCSRGESATIADCRNIGRASTASFFHAAAQPFTSIGFIKLCASSGGGFFGCSDDAMMVCDDLEGLATQGNTRQAQPNGSHACQARDVDTSTPPLSLKKHVFRSRF